MQNIKPHTSLKYIVPINMNKLRGRMLNLPKFSQKSKLEFLLVYGQKSTIEKWTVLAHELRNYGNVTMPDLPGIGGMQSFYKIGELPTIDNYADYLASFIQLRFSRKKITIVGMSFGFVIVTRMLQKYPEITKKINLIINLSGFTNKNDLKLSNWQKKQIKAYSRLFSSKSMSKLYRTVIFEESVFKLMYKRKSRIGKNTSTEKRRKLIKADYNIQKKNDTRTQMFLLGEILRLDNTKKKINLPVWSLVGKYDEYLYSENVKSNLESIYIKYHEIKLKKSTHMVEFNEITPEYVAEAMPYKLKQLFNRQNRAK